MTVAVAHQVSPTSKDALAQAVREAQSRGTGVAVLHVVDSSIDPDRHEAYRLGVSDEIERVVGENPSVPWRLHLAPAGGDVAETLLGLLKDIDADLLVVGARRRSPVGKALLGSVAQTLILEADLPVLVVKVKSP
jgi:nucleotide-binding universal stress UspA family protein